MRAKTRVQKPGESLQEFEAEIRRLIHLAYPLAPEEFQEQLAAQTFIDGLRDPEVQRTLRLTTFYKSSEALVRALEIEAAYNISRPKIRAVAVQEPQQWTVKEERCDISSLFQELLQAIKNIGGNRSSTRSDQCFRCGRTGHRKRDCQVQLRSRSPFRGRQGSTQVRSRSPSQDRRSPSRNQENSN